ncbi:hypothetical protein CEXT_503011, partial [Caerostris extrusa]
HTELPEFSDSSPPHRVYKIRFDDSNSSTIHPGGFVAQHFRGSYSQLSDNRKSRTFNCDA